MKNVSDLKYVRSNITSEWLLSNGFRYNRLFSDEDTDVFTYRFPVHKCERFVILECELRVILGEDRIFVDVYDRNTINRYAPFYYCEYGNYDKILNEIWIKINKVIKKLGIKEEGLKCWYKIMQR